jgi:transcriptional accessory protein Tex/SPT6
MVEFNADGSLKLPDWLANQKAENEAKLKTQKCIKIKKQVVSSRTPKSCALNITLSDAFSDNRFIETIYNYFREKSEVPSKLIKINEKEFKVEIGTCFRRCSDCNNLVRRFREFLEGCIIEDNGSCTYENKLQSNFCYEDYFD